MMNCIAIDDEPLALELIKEFCATRSEVHLNETFTDIGEARKYLLKNDVDLVFLDIQMPDGNGIEFYNQNCSDKLVIFTTAYSHYAVKGFELQAIDYLMKPYNEKRFDQAIEKAIRAIEKRRMTDDSDKKYITIKSEYRLINLNPDQIVYIASKDDYVKIYLSDGKFIMSKITTSSMEEKLKFPGFFRIHRSYIVNSAFVSKINANVAFIGELELPIGKKYKKELMAKWNT